MKTPKPKFDPDLSPDNEANKEAAREHKLIFDRRAGVYRDPDGCPVRDKFGQPLG
jgi:hypothetical protein